MARPRNIVASAEVPIAEQAHGETFAVKRQRLGAAAGADKIGCSLVELPPGKKSWPAHFHFGNEEAVFILEGEGVLRLGHEEHAVRAGDYVALRTGPPEHQMINRSALPLRYLALSTMLEPDVRLYPDSGKLGAMCGAPPGGAKEKRTLDVYLKAGPALDYWEGED